MAGGQLASGQLVKVNKKPKYPASLRTDNHEFMLVLDNICLLGPVGPTISENSGPIKHFWQCFQTYPVEGNYVLTWGCTVTVLSIEMM